MCFTADVSEQAPKAVVGKLLLSKAMIEETKCLEFIRIDYHCLSPLHASCVLMGVQDDGMNRMAADIS